MVTMLEDLWDWDWWFTAPESEEVRKMRVKLREAQREYSDAKQRARDEWYKKAGEETSLALPSASLRLFAGSEEKFRNELERYGKEHPDDEVRGCAIDKDNLWYRGLIIAKKRKE